MHLIRTLKIKWQRAKICGYIELIMPAVIFFILLKDYAELNRKLRDEWKSNLKKKDKTNSSLSWLTYEPRGRLGNQLFQFASAFCTAKTTNHQLALPANNLVTQVFPNIRGTKVTQRDIKSHKGAFHNLIEEQSGVFQKRLVEKAAHLKNRNVYLCCFLQSWKYFENCWSDLKQQLSPSSDVLSYSKKLVNEAKEKLVMRGFNSNHESLTCVHIRRGDMNNIPELHRGYSVAPLSYIRRAMNRMKTLHPSTAFLVLSDDILWSYKNVQTARNDTLFVDSAKNLHKEKISKWAAQRNTSRAHLLTSIDLLVMSQCNHSIITTGSFGWWGAWLAGGTTIYYKNYPQPGSEMAKQYNHTDYYPQAWIPLT